MRAAIARESGAPVDAAAPVASGELSRTFEDLVDAHLHFIWRVLRRLGLSAADADDATQQVFIVAAEKGSDVDREAERAFLYAIAVRIAANARRLRSRRREVSSELVEAEPLSREDPERRLEVSRATELLDELLARLPPEQARVLVLAEIEQMTVPAIAELEAIPTGTAASRLRLARQAFRESLAGAVHKNPFSEDAS
ncbi:MAG TPA: sigma-70 family RNA polymerase sigma factor [Polyangiaceae bacterium]